MPRRPPTPPKAQEEFGGDSYGDIPVAPNVDRSAPVIPQPNPGVQPKPAPPHADQANGGQPGGRQPAPGNANPPEPAGLDPAREKRYARQGGAIATPRPIGGTESRKVN